MPRPTETVEAVLLELTTALVEDSPKREQRASEQSWTAFVEGCRMVFRESTSNLLEERLREIIDKSK